MLFELKLVCRCDILQSPLQLLLVRADRVDVRRKRHDVSPASMQLCQRHDLLVDVERLGWADTVVYPRRFNVHYCAGRCPLGPGRRHRAPAVNVSNHAVLRTIVAGGRRRRRLVPLPCCVATSLRPMNLLYKQRNGHYDIWQLDDVVVDACGCR